MEKDCSSRIGERQGDGEMSLKELEEAIKNQPSPVSGALGYVFDGDDVDAYCKRIEVEFDAFKKQTVCIPRNKLEELIKERPQTAIVDFAKRGDMEEVEKEVSAILQWLEKLYLLLGDEK